MMKRIEEDTPKLIIEKKLYYLGFDDRHRVWLFQKGENNAAIPVFGPLKVNKTRLNEHAAVRNVSNDPFTVAIMKYLKSTNQLSYLKGKQND